MYSHEGTNIRRLSDLNDNPPGPRVKHLVSEDFHHVGEMESSERVIDLMGEYGVSSIPVVNEKMQLLGIISERDVLSIGMLVAADSWSWLDGESPTELCARDLMDRNGIVVGPEDSAGRAAALMLEHHLDCIPVVEDSTLVGLLTHNDFTRTFIPSKVGSLNAA